MGPGDGCEVEELCPSETDISSCMLTDSIAPHRDVMRGVTHVDFKVPKQGSRLVAD